MGASLKHLTTMNLITAKHRSDPAAQVRCLAVQRLQLLDWTGGLTLKSFFILTCLYGYMMHHINLKTGFLLHRIDLMASYLLMIISSQWLANRVHFQTFSR